MNNPLDRAMTALVLLLMTACDPGPRPHVDEVQRRNPAALGQPTPVPPPAADTTPTTDADTQAPPPDAYRPPTAAEELAALCRPEGLVAATCRVHVGCRLGATMAELDACREHIAAVCQASLPGLVARVEARRLAFSSVGLARCEARLEGLTCDTPAAMRAAVGDACDEVLIGRISRGETCEHAGDCADGLACVTADGACPGRCLPPRGLGELCQVDLEPCAPSLTCEDGRCVMAHVALGGPCVSSAQCMDGHCQELDDGAFCARKRNDGEACEDDEQCVGGRCAFDLLAGELGLELGRCGKRLGAGEACEPLLDGCADGLVCDAATSRCVTPGGVGGACLDGEVACPDAALVCAEGRCELEPTLGDPCDPAEPGACAFGYCAGSAGAATCVPYLSPGAPCTSDVSCGAWSCLGGVCAEPPGRCEATRSDIDIGARFRIR